MEDIGVETIPASSPEPTADPTPVATPFLEEVAPSSLHEPFSTDFLSSDMVVAANRYRAEMDLEWNRPIEESSKGPFDLPSDVLNDYTTDSGEKITTTDSPSQPVSISALPSPSNTPASSPMHSVSFLSDRSSNKSVAIGMGLFGLVLLVVAVLWRRRRRV
jgi:MYXO-CTERM domain-containing protein